MSNPLSTLVQVDERADGVYIKYSRDMRSSVSVDMLIKTLQDFHVVNCDLAVLRGVVERARGVFEKIAPPFEYYSEIVESYIELLSSPMRATVKVGSRALAENVRISEAILMTYLNRRNIVYGLKPEAIRKLLQEKAYDTEVVVAEGEPAQNGRNAIVEFEIKINPDAQPRALEGGKVDFRDIQTFTAVKEGQVIARYYPPTPGTPGRTINGDQLPAKPGENVLLPAGKNTTVSDDGVFLKASKTGVIYKKGNLVHVEEILHISSNVDFSVGNIKYSGDVYINGSVMPGFCIESEGSVQVQGEVEGARIISRNGSVIINKGIIGKKDTYIYGKEGVLIDFAQEAEIRTDKTLTIRKYLLHCTVVCNNFDGTIHNVSVVGGSLNAYESIRVCNVGNEKNIPTKVTIVNRLKEQADKKIKELQELRDKLTKQIEPLIREIKTKTTMLRQAKGAVTDRSKELVNKIVEQYNALNAKVQYVDKKIAEAQNLMNEPASYEGFVEVLGTVYPGVEIDLYGLGSTTVRTPMQKKTFKITEPPAQDSAAK